MNDLSERWEFGETVLKDGTRIPWMKAKQPVALPEDWERCGILAQTPQANRLFVLGFLPI